jgi:hypothetical protein
MADFPFLSFYLKMPFYTQLKVFSGKTALGSMMQLLSLWLRQV